MQLKQKTISGVKWNTINQIIIQIVTIITSIILGRFFLSPKEYGLMGMITVFTGFADVLKDFGISAAIIHKKDITKENLSTAFWLNIGIGCFIGLVFVVSAPYIATFYNEAILQKITYFVSFHFIVSTFTIVQMTLLVKSMEFKQIFAYNVCALSVASLVALYMASAGWGVWALVAQQLTNSIVLNICLWSQSRWKPIFLFEKKSLKEILSFSSYLFMSSSINYWNKNIDNLLIGKFVSSSALGNYSRAYMLMMAPTTQIVMMLSKVLFPALSVLQDDLPKVKEIYMRALAIIALGTFPLSVVLWIVADDFIILLLGQKWAEVIPIFKILAWAGMLRTIISPAGNLLYALGKTNIDFYTSLISSTLGITSMSLGLWLGGVYGVALGVCAWSLTAFFINLIVLNKVVAISPLFFIQNIFSILIATTIMGIATFTLKNNLLIDLPIFIRLSVTIIIAMTSYIGLVYLLKIKSFFDAKSMFFAKK